MVSIVTEVILSLHIQEVVMSNNLEQIPVYEPAHKILVLVALSSNDGSEESAQMRLVRTFAAFIQDSDAFRPQAPLDTSV